MAGAASGRNRPWCQPLSRTDGPTAKAIEVFQNHY